jgi:DNA-binding transcriptional regulator YhcF (GntR family)
LINKAAHIRCGYDLRDCARVGENELMGRTLIALERGAREPIYQQLRKALEHAIASGALNPRLPLPSSRELARELGVSRNTVNTAYQELHAEGFVEARPRRGLFVNPEMLMHLDYDEEQAADGEPVGRHGERGQAGGIAEQAAEQAAGPPKDAGENEEGHSGGRGGTDYGHGCTRSCDEGKGR